MINVVPSNVQLSEEITMLPVKVTNVGLTIDGDVLVFKATLRVRDYSHFISRVIDQFFSSQNS